jgi:hypothetical protein
VRSEPISREGHSGGVRRDESEWLILPEVYPVTGVAFEGIKHMTGTLHTRRRGRSHELVFVPDRDAHRQAIVGKCYDPQFKSHLLTVKVVLAVVE